MPVGMGKQDTKREPLRVAAESAAVVGADKNSKLLPGGQFLGLFFKLELFAGELLPIAVVVVAIAYFSTVLLLSLIALAGQFPVFCFPCIGDLSPRHLSRHEFLDFLPRRVE